MKHLKMIIAVFALTVLAMALTSCSRSTMRKGTEIRNDAKRGIDNAIRKGENVVDYGLGALDGSGNAAGDGYYRGGKGMNDGFGTYSANGGYDGFTGNGTMTTGNGAMTKDKAKDMKKSKGMNLLPSLSDTSKDNYGQINTTNGSADGGMGDMYDDMNMSRNSLRTDKLDKKYVKR